MYASSYREILCGIYYIFHVFFLLIPSLFEVSGHVDLVKKMYPDDFFTAHGMYIACLYFDILMHVIGTLGILRDFTAS